jgi:hypothetical protein
MFLPCILVVISSTARNFWFVYSRSGRLLFQNGKLMWRILNVFHNLFLCGIYRVCCGLCGHWCIIKVNACLHVVTCTRFQLLCPVNIKENKEKFKENVICMLGQPIIELPIILEQQYTSIPRKHRLLFNRTDIIITLETNEFIQKGSVLVWIGRNELCRGKLYSRILLFLWVISKNTCKDFS